MWQRNLLFFALCLSGVVAIAASLLRGDRIEEPSNIPVAKAGDDFQVVVAKVNLEFREHWNCLPPYEYLESGDIDRSNCRSIEFAQRADDLTIARRLSIGLTGTVPSFEELRLLESKSEDIRLQWWLAHLLEDRRYADYVAERFARAYVGTDNGAFLVFRRRRFVTWLRDRFAENYPYNELVRNLMSDTGLWTDSPAVNFVTATLDGNDDGQPDPIRLAGKTSRAFLGMRIDCVQCHDDMLGNVILGKADEKRDALQTDFHQLAAFFGQTNMSFLGIKDGKGEYEYQFLDADETAQVPAVVPWGEDFLSTEGTRREALANWITHEKNKPFARAAVNRVWALMCGRPLVDPVDDIPLFERPDDDVLFPPGFETLAEDFIQHGYDIQRLIRIIANTEVYQRSSRADFEVTAEHEDNWAVFPLTRLRPEQVAGALIQATTLTTIDRNSHIIFQLQRFNQQSEFIKRYGDMGEDEFEDRGGTITQRLLMMNGQLTHERIHDNPLVSAAPRISALAPTDEQAVEVTYLSSLTRRPTEKELNHFKLRLSGKRGDERNDVIQDMFWTLLNSTEFLWNH